MDQGTHSTVLAGNANLAGTFCLRPRNIQSTLRLTWLKHTTHHLVSVLEVVGGVGVLGLLGFPAGVDGKFQIRLKLYSLQPLGDAYVIVLT